ncbi:hypothetical protein AAZX31_06G264800 [Glycine max]
MFLFFVSFSFVSRDIFINFDSFSIEMYGFMGLRVYINLVHGLTKMCKSSICICHSMSLFLLAYGIATTFGSIH